MAAVLIPLAIAALAGLAVVLIPGLEQRISADIADINGSFVKGVTQPVIQAWVEVASIGTALAIAIWLLENKISKAEGLGPVGPPAPPSLALPAAPTFGSSAGLRAGPFTSGVTSSTGGAAPPIVYATPPPPAPVAPPAPRPPKQRGGRKVGSLQKTP
jgi:hypothetical protein